jgi:glycosyltransferase involved in cell wall biosynthesis
MNKSYSIVMFAHNEQDNIVMSVKSVFENSDENLHELCVVANGCTDNTIVILKRLQDEFGKLTVIDLDVGDKCNAWNSYVYQYASKSNVHFFVDADVRFTSNAFPLMHKSLMDNSDAWAIAGLPFSGRNIDRYKEMVSNEWCLFGNCYGLKSTFLDRIVSADFKLPIGLGWIDSAITRAIYSDVDYGKKPIKGRVIFDPNCGYEFDSLSFFRLSDWSLYINRVTRYRLGKMQEKYLEVIPYEQWPDDLLIINKKILEDIKNQSNFLNFFDRYLVANRLVKFISKMQP